MIDKYQNEMNNRMSHLDRIQHILMLRSKFIPNVGLLNGKMGIIISFAHLYEYTHSEVYYDYMSELLDDVMEHIYKSLDFGFMSGLSGVGWGIEYLLQNQFVEGQGIEICEEIDWKIMTFDSRRIIDLSLDSGLEGLLHYVLIHIRGNNEANALLPFDERYFTDLYERVKLLSANHGSSSLIQLSIMYMDWYENRLIFDYRLDIMQFVCPPIVDVNQGSLIDLPLGIKDGLSGLLLKQLLV